MKTEQGEDRLNQLSEIFFTMIKLNPEKYGVPRTYAENVTLSAIQQEVRNFLHGTNETTFIAKIFDKMIRDLVDAGLVTTKSGRLFTANDYGDE